MDRFTIVTAIYNIYPTTEYRDILWGRLHALSNHFHLVTFCSCSDTEIAKKIPNITPIYMELSDTQTYKLMNDCSGVPEVRNEIKDTSEYMRLINAKVEFLRLAVDHFDTPYYMWIDAGIIKVISSETVLQSFYDSLTRYDKSTVHIPGTWGALNSDSYDAYVTRIYWRFCGGQIIIPRTHVNSFLEYSLQAIKTLIDNTGKLTWETMIWAYMESRMHDKPFEIEWISGDHNDTMFAPF